MSDNTYSISDLAREFGVTTRTIRFYEEKGLIAPQRNGQQRIYSKADRVRLKLIFRGKRIGLSLEECVEVIDMYQHGRDNAQQLRRLLDKIDEKQREFERRITDLNAVIADLGEVRRTAQQALRQINPNQER